MAVCYARTVAITEPWHYQQIDYVTIAQLKISFDTPENISYCNLINVDNYGTYISKFCPGVHLLAVSGKVPWLSFMACTKMNI